MRATFFGAFALSALVALATAQGGENAVSALQSVRIGVDVS